MRKGADFERLLKKIGKSKSEKGISALSDHLKREKMLKVQKQVKRSFGHRLADVNTRDALIEAIMEACSKPHKKKFKFK